MPGDVQSDNRQIPSAWPYVPAMRTLPELSRDLALGKTTSEKIVHTCLENIASPAGEGARAFITVYADVALEAARASDIARGKGQIASAIAGIPISIKDLFDVQGEVTRAGSKVLTYAPPATSDAPAIARLRAAGVVIVGRTNMTEFAYGAHGMNAHYGTPMNSWDRGIGRIPGGSTSGGAISVTDDMAAATIGSDTGGSVRIPAALCGIVGFKPTQARIPLAGAFPLSFSRDSIGPLGRSAACCVWLDQIMAGGAAKTVATSSLKGMRFGVPTTILLDGLAPQVAQAFARALTTLSAAGATIEEFDFPALQQEADGRKKANFSAVEAYALHRMRLATHLDQFDPRVAKRLLLGAGINAADYVDLLLLRRALIALANVTTARFDALLAPTVPIIAPTIAEMESSEAFFLQTNGLLLRNCAPFNVLDRPCWSLPCHRRGDAPVGLMVVGESMGDERLQSIGLAVEAAIAPSR
ncbi:MAG: amidase [Burkholderiales bacterium]|nr:amidase [Burkholderiales bacterium]